MAHSAPRANLDRAHLLAAQTLGYRIMNLKLIFSVLTFGITAAAANADVVLDGKPVNIFQNGPYLNIDGQTYAISQSGTTTYINTIGIPRSGSASIVPNLTPEQAAAYLNSTPEGRAASAKFDLDLKASEAKFKADLKASEAKWNAELNLSASKTKSHK